jgi:excisionase family DNA binding protein
MRVASTAHRLPEREPTPQAPEFTDRILTVAQVMALTDLSRSTVERARKDRELPFIQLTPRRVGLRASALQRWLASRELAALESSEAA